MEVCISGIFMQVFVCPNSQELNKDNYDLAEIKKLYKTTNKKSTSYRHLL